MPKTKDAFALRSIHEIFETYDPDDGFHFEKSVALYEEEIMRTHKRQIADSAKKKRLSRLQAAIANMDDRATVCREKFLIETSKRLKTAITRHEKRLNELLKSYALLLVSERAKDVTAQVYRLNRLLDAYETIGDALNLAVSFQHTMMRANLSNTKKEVQKLFGERLRQARRKAQFDAVEIASYIGVSRNTYWEYERGLSAPSLVSIRTLAQLYDVSVDWLLAIDT